jgi:hypothetical protein
MSSATSSGVHERLSLELSSEVCSGPPRRISASIWVGSLPEAPDAIPRSSMCVFNVTTQPLPFATAAAYVHAPFVYWEARDPALLMELRLRQLRALVRAQGPVLVTSRLGLDRSSVLAIAHLLSDAGTPSFDRAFDRYLATRPARLPRQDALDVLLAWAQRFLPDLVVGGSRVRSIRELAACAR